MAYRKYLTPQRFATPLILAFVTVALAFTSGCANETSVQMQRVEIKGEVFDLELALTGSARIQGLSGRESIAPDGGMLFVFPREAERAFVMRDCLVPIDILFLNAKGAVLNTHAMQTEPLGTPDDELKHYRSEAKSSLVIELAGGTVERLEIKKGDVIELPVLELKRRAK